MVKFDAFEVEQWMDTYETTPGVLNLAETCASSISIDELKALSGEELSLNLSLPRSSTKLTYGDIRGSSTLRTHIAGLIAGQEGHFPADNVIVTQGAIGANFLTFYALVQPGDHVICVYPTYQQLYSVPESLGAEVSLWRLQEENGFVPDVDELERLVKANTKMIVINNPNNPTGAIIPAAVLQKIVAFARERNIVILSDEVYRPLFHEGLHGNPDMPPSVATLGYDKVVVTGSMSKAYALAGLRLGWVASRDRAIVERLAQARDYTTISVSQLDDQVASYALSPAVVGPLLERNISLARRNAGILKAFVERHGSACVWQANKAGTTAFLQFRSGGRPVDDVAFCKDVLEKTKVMLVPGSLCFGKGTDFAGYVRMGYVCETSVLEEGLLKLGAYIEEHLAR
ncbi:Capreomycidine synthase [Escovopsis weberi]|uniref:Capreomycidine synthase n=1 Tax=Escovopsis weberi TaxID=150374 RepID=A0A0M8N551_ESCWE|nr:Capreomycidine synthase [Escovopsis weberi]